MRRRAFTAGALSLAAAPIAARAQQQGPSQPRLALVNLVRPVAEFRDGGGVPWFDALHAGLKAQGLIDGRNLAIEYWSGLGRSDFDELARQVVASAPDIVVAMSVPTAMYLQKQTQTVPILFFGNDPIAYGLVTSLATPGGNVTGFTADTGIEVVTKRLELLDESLPGIRRIAHLGAAINLAVEQPQVERAASALGVSVAAVAVEDPVGEPIFRRAFERIVQLNIRAALLSAGTQNSGNSRLIAPLAIEYGVATLGTAPDYAQSGGLMGYGPNYSTQYKGIAGYVARILNGEKPGKLPVQQPTKFDLIVNLKTAKALRIEFPFQVLARADEVIE